MCVCVAGCGIYSYLGAVRKVSKYVSQCQCVLYSVFTVLVHVIIILLTFSTSNHLLDLEAEKSCAIENEK